MDLHKTDEMMLELLSKLDDGDAAFLVSKFIHDHDTMHSPWVNAWMKEHEDWMPTMLKLHQQGRAIRFYHRMRRRFHPVSILMKLVPLALALFAARAMGLI